MKKTYEVKITFTCEPDNKEVQELKAAIQSGEMQRDMRKGTGLKKLTATFKEV